MQSCKFIKIVRTIILRRTNTNLSTSLPLSKPHSQPVTAVSQKNEPPEPIQDSNHADDLDPMQVDMQPAPLMSQSEPSPPLQHGMPKDYWKSARDNMNSQIMRTLKTRPPEYVVDFLMDSTSIQTTKIIIRKCVLIKLLY